MRVTHGGSGGGLPKEVVERFRRVFEDLDSDDEENPLSSGSSRKKKKKKERKNEREKQRNRYHPLNIQQSEFRLCTIAPGIEGTTECNLSVVDLKTVKPEYYALSYAWGSKDEINPKIILDGTQFPVTQNLYNALIEIRKPTTPVVLWVDYLCINQTDSDEKSHQVRMMRDIYSRAHEVLVWVAPADGNGIGRSWTGTSLDKTNATSLLEVAAKNPIQIPEYRTATLFFLSQMAQGDHILLQPVLHHAFHRFQVLSELRNLVSWPWWERIWVVQETVVPRNVKMLFGGHRMPWDMLGSAARNLEQHRQTCCAEALKNLSEEEARVLDQYIDSVLTIEVARDAWSRAQPMQLLNLAWQFRSREATDPRDKIFALLGLSEDHNSLPIIDYSEGNSSLKLYRSVVVYSILQTKSLNALIGAPERKGLDLPSWVPDWSVPFEPFSLERINRAETLFDASKGVDSVITPAECDGDSGHVFNSQGILVSTVAGIGVAATSPAVENLRIVCERWKDFVRAFFDAADASMLRTVEYVTGGSIDDALLRTFCADTISSTTLDDHLKAMPTQRVGRSVIEDIATLSPASRRAHIPIPSRETFAWAPGTGIEALFASGIMDSSVRSAAMNRRIFITTNGHVGLGPLSTKIGDAVYVLAGGRTPFILRRCTEGSVLSREEEIRRGHEVGNCFSVVGDCYVHGIMRGEMFEGKSPTSIRSVRLV